MVKLTILKLSMVQLLIKNLIKIKINLTITSWAIIGFAIMNLTMVNRA